MDTTQFIGTCGLHGNGLMIYIPKDVVEFMELERRDKLHVTIRKTGRKSERRIREHPFKEAHEVLKKMREEKDERRTFEAPVQTVEAEA